MKSIALCVLLLGLLLAGCSLPQVTPAADVPPPVTPPPQSCGWQWASQPLPELSLQVEQAMQAAVQPQARASAQAYGENCRQADGSVAYFATLETDFYVTLGASDLNDEAALGALLEQVLTVLDGFPPSATPGPQSGYARVTFVHGEEERTLWFPLTLADQKRREGLRGADLLRALENR